MAVRQADLVHHRGGGVRHEGLREDGDIPDRLDEVGEHRPEPRQFSFILRQRPGGGLVDILVAPLGEGEDSRQGVGGVVLVHIALHRFGRLEGGIGEVAVQLVFDHRRRQLAAKVLIRHRNGAVDEVADGVGEVGVVFGDKGLVGDAAVLGVGHRREEVVADGVDPEEVYEVVGVDDVAFGLAHLVGGEEEPGVAEDLFRQRQVEAHQEDRPVDGVEPEDVLADDVQVGRPELFKLLGRAVGVVADGGDIVVEGVQPDVDDMLRVEVNRDAPFKGSAADAEVLEARL